MGKRKPVKPVFTDKQLFLFVLLSKHKRFFLSNREKVSFGKVPDFKHAYLSGLEQMKAVCSRVWVLENPLFFDTLKENTVFVERKSRTIRKCAAVRKGNSLVLTSGAYSAKIKITCKIERDVQRFAGMLWKAYKL